MSAQDATINAIIPHLRGISHRGHKADYLIAWARYLVASGGDVGNSLQALFGVGKTARSSGSVLLTEASAQSAERMTPAPTSQGS